MSARCFHLLLPGKLDQHTGGYQYDRHIVEGLRRHGWRITVHELDTSFPFPDVPALDHAARVLSDLPDDALVVLDGLALGAMPDVVATHALRCRLIALVHHPLALETGLDPAAARALHASERQALSHACAVITTSTNTTRALQNYAVAEDHITSVSPGVELPSLPAPAVEQLPFDSSEASKPAQTRSLNLLCVATLTRRKGHDVLIAALQLLIGTPWTLVCVGSDQRDAAWADSLRAQISDAGLSERIHLTGEVSTSELDEHYRGADVFVLASHYEGYGMVFDEAIAYGLPIVATTGGAIADTVPEAAGLLVPPNDSRALAGALSELLDSDERWHTLRESAHHARLDLRSWDQACIEFAAVLDHVQTRQAGKTQTMTDIDP